MTTTPPDPGCRQLASLLAATGDDEQAERVLEAHIAACRDCATAEAALAALVGRFRAAAESPLASRFERRLMRQLCGDPHR